MQCDICGKQIFVGKQKNLKNGRICKGCMERLPYVYKETPEALKLVSIEEYKDLVIWEEKQNKEECRPSTSYGRLHLDPLNGYIMLGYNDIPEENTIINLADVRKIAVHMVNEKSIRENINVNVELSLSVEGLPDIKDFYLKNDNAMVSVNDGHYIEYTLPYGAQMIQDEIIRINHKIIDDAVYNMSHSLAGEDTEYIMALGLFMVNDGEYTLKQIKQMRNKLMKTFHPDEGEKDTFYSEKIMSAYELLAERIAE